VQQVNNETGVIQPIWAKRSVKGAVWLADCAQGAGKIAFARCRHGAVAGHKIGAPPGIGALLLRDWA
jgi:cysteine desulfurase